jgi:hypothetical protein
MYYMGLGVPQDYVQAHMWVNLAVSRFPTSQKEARDETIEMRNRIASKMTPAQIAEAQKLARGWKAKPRTIRSGNKLLTHDEARRFHDHRARRACARPCHESAPGRRIVAVKKNPKQSTRLGLS